MTMDARATIRQYLGGILARKGDLVPFNDDDSLLLTGRIDSINVLEIVGFLARQFGYEISEDAFDPGLFDSVEAIVRLVNPVEP
jgi:acyl carrier protein